MIHRFYTQTHFKLCVINLPFATILICFYRPLNAGRVQKSHIFKKIFWENEAEHHHTFFICWEQISNLSKKNSFMLVNAVIFLLLHANNSTKWVFIYFSALISSSPFITWGHRFNTTYEAYIGRSVYNINIELSTGIQRCYDRA